MSAISDDEMKIITFRGLYPMVPYLRRLKTISKQEEIAKGEIVSLLKVMMVELCSANPEEMKGLADHKIIGICFPRFVENLKNLLEDRTMAAIGKIDMDEAYRNILKENFTQDEGDKSDEGVKPSNTTTSEVNKMDLVSSKTITDILTRFDKEVSDDTIQLFRALEFDISMNRADGVTFLLRQGNKLAEVSEETANLIGVPVSDGKMDFTLIFKINQIEDLIPDRVSLLAL